MVLDISKVKPPRKISPCPVINATVEFRFSTATSHNAIIGIIYNVFKKDYPKLTELSTMHIPEAIRRSDKNLRYSTYYQLSSADNQNHFFVGLAANSHNIIVIISSSNHQSPLWDVLKDALLGIGYGENTAINNTNIERLDEPTIDAPTIDDNDMVLAEDIYGPVMPPNSSVRMRARVVAVKRGKPSVCDEIGW